MRVRARPGLSIKLSRALVILLLLGSALYPIVAYAQTTTASNQLPNVIVLPDNPLYPLKRNLYEPLQAFFSFTPQAKANTYLSEADARIAELQAMHDAGNDQHDNDLTGDYQAKMDLVNASLTAITDNDTRASVGENVVAATSRHLEVLQHVLSNAPAQAQRGLLNAIAKSQNGVQHAAQNLANHEDQSVVIAKVSCSTETGKATCTTTTATLTPESHTHATVTTWHPHTTESQTFTETGQFQALQTFVGVFHAQIENPKCYPQCAGVSLVLYYLQTSAGRYLLKGDFNRSTPNGTTVTATGLIVRTTWHQDGFTPKISFDGDIIAESIS